MRPLAAISGVPGTGRALRRPRLAVELALVVGIYLVYDAIRGLIRADARAAERHGYMIWHWEQVAHLDPERDLNALFARSPVLAVPACFFYASLHFLVTPAVMIWLYRRHPDRYRRARTTLAVTTATALAGFWLFPTAPPRLLAAGGYPAGFQDTMAHYSAWGWWAAQDSAPRGLASLANQFAAMPSLHFAWALWCGISLARYASGPAPRLLGALYPLATAIVILGTANHYLLDVLGGGAIVLAADTTTRTKLLNYRTRCLLIHQPGTDRYRPEGPPDRRA